SIAKLACDFAKPDGCLVIKPVAERAFLRPLPVGKLSGVGPHTYERLVRLGLTTVGDVADADPAELARPLGQPGRWLWQLAIGCDDRPVVSDPGPPKSGSRETTFERDLASLDRAEVKLRELAENVARHAERERLIGRTVHLKARWADFRRMTRQCPL